VGDNEFGDNTNAGKLTMISMAMAMQRYDARHIARWRAHPGLHLKPTDAAIGRVPALYCPVGCHG